MRSRSTDAPAYNRTRGSEHALDLSKLAHLKLTRQAKLTSRAYETVVTAPTLPMLSLFQVETGIVTCWAEPMPLDKKAGTLTYFDRMLETPPKSGDLRDSPIPVILRPEDWIVELEQRIGYVPCVHPEEYYRSYNVDDEPAIEHPIALDPTVMARRGQPVPDPGPKPSLMARQRERLCAICGSPSFTFDPYPPDLNPYSYQDPDWGRWCASDADRAGTGRVGAPRLLAERTR